MNGTAKAQQNTFYERKAERKYYYETYVKGWRLRECYTCRDGEVQGNRANCPTCLGSGRAWAEPDCATDIKPLIGQTLRVEVIPDVEIRIYIQSDRRVVQQFVSLHDGLRDPHIYAKLEFGYDEKNQIEDWYVTNTFGSRLYLHEFKRMGKRPSVNT